MTLRATVIIAAYKAADVLPRSIASAQRQTGADIEVIVVDDASIDDTLAIARANPDVTAISLDHNSGPAAARNRTIDAATGDWIVVLDADDTMRPDRIADMAAVADTAGADVVLGNFIRVDGDETPIDPGPFLAEDEVDPAQPVTLESYVAANAMTPDSRNYGYLKPMFRREFLDRHKIRYDETLRNSEDYHIVLALLAAGAKVVISPRPDYLYQVSAGSISHRVAPALIARLIEADDRFERRLGAARTPALTDLLAQRRLNLTNMMHAESVLQAIKDRRLTAAVAMLAARPRTVARVFRQICEAIKNRLVPS